jgi:HPt (histidine-containing phosphotransfer) domain-containing protein
MKPVHSSFAADPDMVEIVREFALELPGRADRLEGLLAAGALDELRVMAHQLKGAGGGYGFDEITQLAAALEHAIHERRPAQEIDGRTGELCKLLRAVVAPELA